jgi:hypothetical protein
MDMALLLWRAGDPGEQAALLEHLRQCARCTREFLAMTLHERLGPDAASVAGEDEPGARNSLPEPAPRPGGTETPEWAFISDMLRADFQRDRTVQVSMAPGWDGEDAGMPEHLLLAADSPGDEGLPTLSIEDPEVIVKFRRNDANGTLRAYLLTRDPRVSGDVYLRLPGPDRSFVIPESGSAEIPALTAAELRSMRIEVRLRDLPPS